jgi:hypothetical protein
VQKNLVAKSLYAPRKDAAGRGGNREKRPSPSGSRAAANGFFKSVTRSFGSGGTTHTCFRYLAEDAIVVERFHRSE